MQTYEVGDSERMRYVPLFQTEGLKICMSIKLPPENVCPISWIEAAVRDINDYLLNSRNLEDFIGIALRDASFDSGVAYFHFRLISKFFANDLWTLIFVLTWSVSVFKLSERFTISPTINASDSGGKRVHLSLHNISKKSISTVQNDNNLFLPRSIAAGVAYAACIQARAGTTHETC